jgi:hypothetical protein
LILLKNVKNKKKFRSPNTIKLRKFRKKNTLKHNKIINGIMNLKNINKLIKKFRRCKIKLKKNVQKIVNSTKKKLKLLHNKINNLPN